MTIQLNILGSSIKYWTFEDGYYLHASSRKFQLEKYILVVKIMETSFQKLSEP